MTSNETRNSSPSYISDQPLPLNQDFLRLKQSALEYIQKINGHVWSNYNETDPGVTILEQVCYAISELAYCSDFPIADILTGEDGKIAFHNQFYEAAAILTSNPLTLRDFQNLIFDRFSEVRAIYLHSELTQGSEVDQLTGRYQVSLVLDAHSKDQSDTKSGQISAAIHHCLNQHRNLAEWFLFPRLLKRRELILCAQVSLERGQNAASVRAEIQQALSQFVLPRPLQSGFQALQASGLSSDEILNGPRLQHGWISSTQLLQAEPLLRLSDISLCISAVQGVAALSGLGFRDYPGSSVLVINSQEYAELIVGSEFIFVENGIIQTYETAAYQSQLQIAALKSQHARRGVEAQLDLAPALPLGNYRDIASYYSIQNTFPDIYGVGPNSLEQAAPAYRIAAARQLKAYLLVYDQILTNQFAQLAHLADLFAFTPKFSQLKTNKAQPSNPGFAQTYYWQTLYQVPDVTKLLRGHEQFSFSLDPQQTQTAREKQAWQRFTASAYNEYVYGLQQATESEASAEQRREAFLNHMLARQGYFMGDYDGLLQNPVRYGTARRSRIIAKTIWLQNEQILSYARYSAYDPVAARKLSDLASYAKLQTLAAQQRQSQEAIQSSQPKPTLAGYPEINGAPDLSRIWAQHKLRQQDLADFSSFECRLDQLLGLREHLQQVIRCLKSVLADPAFMRWLLRLDTDANIFLPDAELYLQTGERCDIISWRTGAQTESLLRINWSAADKGCLADYQQVLLQLSWLAEQRRGCLLLEPILLLDESQTIETRLYAYCLAVYLIFPDAVERFRSAAFLRDLQQVQRQFFPLHLDLQLKWLTPALLQALIPSFTNWHNHADSPALKQKYASQLQRLLQLPLSARAQHAE